VGGREIRDGGHHTVGAAGEDLDVGGQQRLERVGDAAAHPPGAVLGGEAQIGDPGEVLVEREIEGGRRERLNLKLPAVLTIQSGINIPRYPALSHMLRSRTAAIELIEAHALAPRASSGTRIRCAPAEAGSVGEFLEGTPEQKALRLLEILHEHSLL